MRVFNWRILFLASSFAAGFSLMTVEITATRIVAPYIGLSVYTWTSIIGAMLLGHSAGSYLGGYFIDKHSHKKMLGFVFLAATLFVGIIPLLSSHLYAFTQWNVSLLIITLAISLSLFFLPSFFLGTLYPSILRLSSSTIQNMGKNSGLLSSLWSLGSILGTFLTGFYFIGYLGSFVTILVVALILFIFGVIFLAAENRKYGMIGLIPFAVFLYTANNISSDKNPNTLFNKESAYYKIQVIRNSSTDWGGVKMLFLDFDLHSVESENNQKLNIYTEISPIFAVFNQAIEGTLVIGGGSYAIAKKLSTEYPNNEVTVAEIDPLVTQTAQDFFNLNDYPIKTINQDARFFLSHTDKKYDLIFGDAYNSFISLPWHLTTYEFNEVVKNRLTRGGIYAVNFISALEGENSEFFQSMRETFKQTFPNYYIFKYGSGTETPQSIILVGVNSDKEVSLAKLREKIKDVRDGLSFVSKLTEISPQYKTNVLVLKDNFAPIERLMAPITNYYFPSYADFYYRAFRKI